jgi:hypothetical protein
MNKHQVKKEDFENRHRTLLAQNWPIKLELVTDLTTLESEFVVTDPIGKSTMWSLEQAIQYYNNMVEAS